MANPSRPVSRLIRRTHLRKSCAPPMRLRVTQNPMRTRPAPNTVPPLGPGQPAPSLVVRGVHGTNLTLMPREREPIVLAFLDGWSLRDEQDDARRRCARSFALSGPFSSRSHPTPSGVSGPMTRRRRLRRTSSSTPRTCKRFVPATAWAAKGTPSDSSSSTAATPFASGTWPGRKTSSSRARCCWPHCRPRGARCSCRAHARGSSRDASSWRRAWSWGSPWSCSRPPSRRSLHSGRAPSRASSRAVKRRPARLTSRST